jgi:hypothetical protein
MNVRLYYKGKEKNKRMKIKAKKNKRFLRLFYGNSTGFRQVLTLVSLKRRQRR